MQRYPDLEAPQGYQSQQPMAHGGMPGQGGYPVVNGGMPGQGEYPMGHKAAAYIMPDQAAPAPQKGGFQKLQDLNGIFIKQKLELLEVVTGCETENKYHVHSIDKSGKGKGKKLFKCKEKSSCFARQCMSGDCRPFSMEISTLVRGEDDDYEPFLRLERDCKCTCLCLQRPEIMVTLVEGGKNEYLGKIVDPWNCCNMEFNIYDKDHNKKFNIEGSCCQCGVWCSFPCDSCQTIDFDVKSPSGEVMSTLQKRSQGCVKTMVSDADNFILHFPKSATLVDKALLMSAVLFVDFRHFESKEKENQGGPAGNH